MNAKIALGFGDNIDYEIVWDSGVFERLIVKYDIHDAELDINRVITSERDLVISILAFLKAGSGGERFVAASSIVEDFSQSFEKKITLGGTSVRAAITLAKFGYTSALHLVTINEHVRQLIPPDSQYVCSNTRESSFPHLIVQFGKDTRVRAGDIDIRAARANRLIYHCDDDNITMALNEDYASLITDAKVLLISGFNAMHSEALLRDRLESLLRIMASLPKEALVYYEDAGFYDSRLSQLIWRTLKSHISVIGLNEDELQAHLDKKLNLLDPLEIRQALVELHALIPAPVIVVHSSHWALAYGETASRYSKILKTATTMATTRFRYGDDFTVENFREIERIPASAETAAFADAINTLPGDKLYCVPVADVEQSNATTIGLGDTFVGGFLLALVNPD